MKATLLFRKLEEIVPPDLALQGDRVGFIGPGDPGEIEVERVLVLMDYLPRTDISCDRDNGFDLLILHHPPLNEPEIPAYVIHSNWDLIRGGASDALAECIGIEVDDLLDEKTGIGRVGRIESGQISLRMFARKVSEVLGVSSVNIVNYQKDRLVERVAVVSGFGLNPDLIKLAIRKGVDVYISGDLTHGGAVLANHAGIVLIDATHHATEMPGLYRLGRVISQAGLQVEVLDTGIPWETQLR